MKYRIEECRNEHALQVHLSKKICGHTITYDCEDDIEEEDELNKASEDNKLLAGALFQIPGIESLSFENYNVHLFKGSCFEWKEMEPEIIRVINVMFCTKEEMEELPRITVSKEEQERGREDMQIYKRLGGSLGDILD